MSTLPFLAIGLLTHTMACSIGLYKHTEMDHLGKQKLQQQGAAQPAAVTLQFHTNDFPHAQNWMLSSLGSCRFIYAFGGAGLFLFLTALSGLWGACYNSRHCLNFYSTMIVVMLLAQCALLVGYFADQSWKKKLPHDDTGEAAKVSSRCLLQLLHACTYIKVGMCLPCL